MTMSMIVVNTDFVPGKEIAEVLGIVKGNVRFMTSMVSDDWCRGDTCIRDCGEVVVMPQPLRPE